MNGTSVWILATLGLFGGMLLLIELDRQLVHRRLARDLEDAVFGLLGLLTACPAESAIASPVRPPRMNIRRAWRVGY